MSYLTHFTSAEAHLLIQVQTDNQIKSDSEANGRLENRVRERLGRYEERISRIELHVSDVDGPRGGANDKRVRLEARPNGLDPIIVTNDADTIESAVTGAADKAGRALERVFGKLTNRKGH